MKGILTIFFALLLSIEIQGAFPPIPISLSDTQSGLSVISDRFGNLVAVWTENNMILTSDLPLNGNWSAPVSLSSPIVTASAPKLEIDSSGTTIAIWHENNRIQARSRPFGGNWAQYAIIPDPSSQHTFAANDHLIEELPPERNEVLCSGNRRQVPCRKCTDSSLDSTLKSRDCAELLAQQTPIDSMPPTRQTQTGNAECSMGAPIRTQPSRGKRWMELVTSLSKARKLTSTNAIDAPSGGALSGVQIGFAAGTAAPSNGLTVSGSLVMNGAALATNATDGFIYESGCAGTPTGVPTAQTGRAAIVVDTTNNIPYFYNGTSPSAVPGGWVPANGMVLISEQVLVGAAASVTFSNIPQVYNHLRLIANVRFSGAATNLLMGIRFNGDSGNNYDRQQGDAFAGTVSSSSGAAVSSIWAGFCPAASSPANAFGQTTTDIAFYTSNSFYKLSQTQSIESNSGLNLIAQTGGEWRNTTAITSMTLIDASSGSNFTIGCSFALYGIN